MAKRIFKGLALAMISIILFQTVAFAEGEAEGTGADGGGTTSSSEPQNVSQATFQQRCDQAGDLKFPECAKTPSDCGSGEPIEVEKDKPKRYRTPFNCLFLEEPIGGQPGYDLYKVVSKGQQGNEYLLWHGEAIVGDKEYGPVQAILVFEPDKAYQGPFGLLYNYLGLVYNFVSGVIVGFVVLVVIVGGIMISTAGGEPDQMTKGKDLIKKALIGMVLWFTASVILYTINPTFFAF